MPETVLKLDQVSKRFGRTKAVDRLSFEVEKGEIFTLLGPSGCGKTTTLRLVAGLERPDAGQIFAQSKLIASGSTRMFVPPHKRNLGMVFQSYAIWPHLTVYENIAYPLAARGVRRDKQRSRVARVLALVGLEGLEDRPAPLLSGGQQQRVALARALVYEPEILLLDEPFSNLDAKLREQVRVEVKLLQRRLGITVLFVTHDQVEALSLSSRILVMNSGRVEQVGVPQELYEAPQRSFVRDFLGKSVMLRGRVVSERPGHPQEVVLTGVGQKSLYVSDHPEIDGGGHDDVYVAIRPEDVELEEAIGGDQPNRLEGTIDTLLFVGDRYEGRIQLGKESILLYLPRSRRWREGQKIRLRLPPEALSVWPR